MRADPRGLRALEVMSGARRIKSCGAYAEGWVELQDLSAQRAVEAGGLARKGRILDYLRRGAAASRLPSRPLSEASLTAHDADPARMRDLPARARGRA